MSLKRVFLVENHEDTVKYIQMFLEHFGYKVGVARDMAEALREIPKARWDVLISDIGLPDGDGWLLLQKLGDHKPGLTIAMSGYGTREDRQKSRAAGYDHHLVKPFQPDALLELLGNLNGPGGTES